MKKKKIYTSKSSRQKNASHLQASSSNDTNVKPLEKTQSASSVRERVSNKELLPSVSNDCLDIINTQLQYKKTSEINKLPNSPKTKKKRVAADKESSAYQNSSVNNEIFRVHNSIDMYFETLDINATELIANGNNNTLLKDENNTQEKIIESFNLDEETALRINDGHSHNESSKHFSMHPLLEQKIQDLLNDNRSLKVDNDRLESKITELSSEIEKYKDLISMLERDQTIAAEKISTLINSELSLQHSLQERFDELATLTNLFVENENNYKIKLNELQNHQKPLTSNVNNSLAYRLKNKLNTIKQHKLKAQKFAENVALIRKCELFDSEWYLQQYPEASSHKHGAPGHYFEYGVQLKTNPSPLFDGNWYLQTYQDVSVSGMNPLFHYIKYGNKENRITKVL
ncbi:hypothetical protein VEE31_45090 (plasmid) [Escherichia coli]|uniref:hypothetical protein n=1 Tax=Escherichia coli TaxID=562 RepID=UPI002B2A5A66|nr:hypothetical protein VEE31_45090 [Escherichia coli]